MTLDFSQFHFIRPEWLLVLPIAILLSYGLQRITSSSRWEDYISKEMVAALRVNDSAQSNRWQWGLLTLWCAMILATAGPAWNKQPVPAMKNQKATVVALDLSPSMLAKDLSPNRLTHAKFKLIDILRTLNDGQVALIAYAGDAHTVSPLTDDPHTVEALLPALHPNVMPNSGSNTEAAIELAQQLLHDAGAMSGNIILITDGVTSEAINNIRQQITGTHSLSILGVGGPDTTPIPAEGGGFLRNSNGEIILVSLNNTELQSFANSTGGRYATINASESDIAQLLDNGFENTESANLKVTTSYDAWADMGYLLALLTLPVVLLFFRKGLVYTLPLFFLLPMDSQANESPGFTWNDLWKTRDQQAKQLLENEQYSEAATKFKRPDWSAIANYRNGDYDSTIAQLDGHNDITSLYNKGNALALKGNLKEAITEYEKVLQQAPDHADATQNKKLLEELIKQNQEQSQKNQQSDQQSNQQQDQNDPQNQSNNKSKDQNQKGQNQQSQEQTSSQSEDNQQNSSQEAQDETQDETQDEEPQQTAQRSDKTEQEQEQKQEHSKSESSQAASQEHPTELSAQQAQTEQPADSETEPAKQSAQAFVQENPTPLKDSSEQWLRTIQNDPSGLLRRKFEYQSWQRAQQGQKDQQPRRNPNKERY